MNEQAPRALLFSIPSLSKELRTLKVRNTRFCLLIIIIFFSFIVLDSRDRLNRKGETARSLEDCRMSMIWWVFFPLRIWCFFSFLDFSCSFSRMIDNNDVMVTCFIKMAVLLFTKGFSYFTSIKPDSTLSSEKKIISWYFFMSKLKCLVHGLSYRAGVLCIRCSSNMFKFVLYLNTRSLSL